MSFVAAHFLKAASRFLSRNRTLEVEGLEHLPESGPVILAVRHYHNLYDGVGLLAHVPRRLHILTGLDWVETRAGRFMMEKLTHAAEWPVLLRTPEASRKGKRIHEKSAYHQREVFGYQRRAYKYCLELLTNDCALVIFPEGYPLIDPHTDRPPRDELLAPFKPGFARVALAAARQMNRDIDVVPIGVRVGNAPKCPMTFALGPPHVVSDGAEVGEIVDTVFHSVRSLSLLHSQEARRS